MKIRNRLYLIFSLFLVLLVMISFTIFRANKQMNKATARAGIANGIGKNLNGLNMVTYEFLLYHEKRMQQQWHLSYTSISKLLKERSEKPDSPEEAAILQSISRAIEAIHVLFLKLNEIHGKRQMRSGGNEQEEKIPSLGPLDALLASELLVKSHHATLGSLRLHAMAQEEILETQRKADSVIIISMIIFMVVLLISGAFTIRSIATPISKLVEGTHVIGKGNFDYKIKVKSRDEIGELAASFNTMAQNLLAREQALRKAHEEVEAKVVERTRELAHANIRLKEVDRLKSEFLATMSHELRTPLNCIIGFTGIILKGLTGEINEEQRKQLSLVYSSSKHLLNLINDILDLSRIESGKMELSVERFKVGDVISEVTHTLSPMISQKGLRLLTEIPDETPGIYSDRKKVLQVLLNLANNAVKFTDKGEIKIECKTDNDHLKVSVSDTGIGIKRENMDYLFESFRQIDGRAQRRYEGAGLGLYLCRKLVTILGGKIWAESEYGKGSSFTFTLALRLE